MTKKLRVLDLFSGIGGFSLGLERTGGFETQAFVEIDPFCRRVLARHWPDVPVYDDVRTLTAATLGKIDVIAGGFPCQDISTAGKGAGITGERSGLWREYARIIGEVRPRYVIVENVAALLHRGLGDVLGDLSQIGYDAEWYSIRASDVGAPHRRDRVWIIAYPQHSDANGERPHRAPQHVNGDAEFCDQQVGVAGSLREDVADADQPRLEGRLRASLRQGGTHRWDEQLWFAQSGMGRVSNGIPDRVHRLKALGNSVVPQIPEIIGRAIMSLQP